MYVYSGIRSSKLQEQEIHIFKPGDKVHYVANGVSFPGIVRSTSKAFFASENDEYFVVFDCDDDWDNYQDYTAIRTKIVDLKPGWPDPDKKKVLKLKLKF